jgi:hypothetical protein
MLPPDKLSKPPCPVSDESALDSSFPRDLIGSHWLANPIKFKQLRVITNEHVTTEETACVGGDSDRIWGCYVPQSGSNYNGFSEGRLIFADKD